jgi:hypothetical protein
MKWLKRVGLLLLASLLVGFAIGTWLRHRAERSVHYIGSAESRPCGPTGIRTAG